MGKAQIGFCIMFTKNDAI